MKKGTLLACAAALVLGAQAVSAQTDQVTYVTDPNQGLLINRMQDNWFITAEGGASLYISDKAVHRKLSDRFMPAASLYVGKHITPVFGVRAGINWLGLKGLATGTQYIGSMPDEMVGQYYKTKYNEFGLVFDVMVNLTNWWCGYNPNRVYNATVYAGAGAYTTFTKEYKGTFPDSWHHVNDVPLTLRAGIINSFRLNDHFALSLDIRMSALSGFQNTGGTNWNKKYGALQGYLGVTYNFNKTTWTAPVVPVYPEPENCDALRARLAAADARIADLENPVSYTHLTLPTT